MTNVTYNFMERRQAALAESAAAAWEEICGDYDPFQKGDGNFDATLRRETSAPALGTAALSEIPAPMPRIENRTYWDIEELPQSAEVIFPKGVWGL